MLKKSGLFLMAALAMIFLCSACSSNRYPAAGPSSTYSVTYLGNGSTSGNVPVDANAYTEGQSVTVLGNTGSLVQTNFTFAGWNTQANSNGTTYAPTATFKMGSANVTLYAQWTPVASSWTGIKQLGVSGTTTEANSVATDASGNVYVAGSTNGGLDGNTLTGSWDADLWGRIKRTIEANRASAQASAADLANARLSAQSQLAIAYFNLGEACLKIGDKDRARKALNTYLELWPNGPNAVQAGAAKTCFATLLITEDPIAMEQALAIIGAQKPLLHAATEANWEKMVALAKRFDCPLVVKGEGLDATAALVEKVSATYKELVLDLSTRQLSQALAELTQTRRLAIKKKFRPFGYPVIAFTASEQPRDQVIEAAAYIAKYASVVVLKADAKAQLLPLAALRMNIFSDPQKPSQVEPKVTAIGAVTADSPVYLTTNFALTYYTVEGEVAASKIPSYLIACPTDGTSVLTAWAAGKFSGEKIAEFIKECGIEAQVNHRKLVVPGHVAVIKGALEEKAGWQVLDGPAEASGINTFAKAHFA